VPGNADLETTIKPEESLDFELGIKSLLLDNRLQLNLNVYQTRLKDYQASWTRQPDLNDPLSRITGFGNAEKVVARGIELDSAYRIGDFTLSLNGAYNEATYETQWLVQKPNIAATQFFDAKGDQIANVPKWGFNQNLSYEIPLGNFLGTVTFSNSYRSGAYLNDNHAADTYQKAYTVSNLGFGFGSEDKSWEVSLFVKNLFDVEYSSTLSTWGNTAAVSQTIGNPRYATVVFRSRIQ
jgi:iron complex outermembrane receptor protein